jgi:hypothetical protein
MVPAVPRLSRAASAMAIFAALAACADSPSAPKPILAAPAASQDVISQTYTSGADVQTWDPIPESYSAADWPAKLCTNSPAVGLNASWVNPHNAFVLFGHPWAWQMPGAPWINSVNSLASSANNPNGAHFNWTKYEREITGNGTFQISLLADNCSWIYLDGTLVGVQAAVDFPKTYGLTLNGTHTLTFIIFDGGGAAGGQFKLETTSNPPPPLNNDLDNDGHVNDADAFPLDPAEWVDTDHDGVGDNHDAFPSDPAEAKDSDGDGVGDNHDAYPNDPTRWSLDADADGVPDTADNCSAVANATQADLDGDGAGDACDTDIDGDGHPNASDAFPANAHEWADTDHDGVGDNSDAFPSDPTEWVDTDNDSVGDNHDNCRAVANAGQADLDHDGVGDACDADMDGDGVPNASDAFPRDSREWADSDQDGAGDNSDPFVHSNTGPALVVGSCQPGVGNWRIVGGTFANDLIAQAYAMAGNHGAFVSAVSDLADGWKKSGRISGRDQGAIVSCAARTK